MTKIFVPLILAFPISCEPSFEDGACYCYVLKRRSTSTKLRYYSNTNSPDECKNNCGDWGYALAGVQKSQCFCANNTLLEESRRHRTQFTVRDCSSVCGRDFGMNIYKTESQRTKKCDLSECGCSCSGFVNENGYGQCKNSKFCYVTMPSNCTGLVKSQSHPGKWYSGQPCKSLTPIWSSWSEWTICSASCGDGKITRSRTCSMEGQCPGESQKTIKCNLPICGFSDMKNEEVYDKEDFSQEPIGKFLSLRNLRITLAFVLPPTVIILCFFCYSTCKKTVKISNSPNETSGELRGRGADLRHVESVNLSQLRLGASGYLSQVRRRSSVIFQEFLATAPTSTSQSYLSRSDLNSPPPSYAEVFPPPTIYSVDPPHYSTLTHQN